MGGGAYEGPDSAKNDSGQPGSKVAWVAVVVSIIALLASAFSAVRAQKAQEQANHLQAQANHIAQQNDRIAQKGTDLQKQLQMQSQAAGIRSSAQQVVLTTSPPEYSAGQAVQGVTIDNGTNKKITNVYVLFTTGPKNYIVDSANYPSLAPCNYMTLSFDPSFSRPADWDAWLYFTDADGNVWTSDLFGQFQKVAQVPSEGLPVTNELAISSSALRFCG